jgi:hypothetical protein
MTRWAVVARFGLLFVLAGKVVGRGGVPVPRRRHGEQDLDSGIRADDKTGYPAWISAIERERGTDD